MFDVGTTLNRIMVDALENEVMRAVYVNLFPQFTTSFGAVIITKERFLEEEE